MKAILDLFDLTKVIRLALVTAGLIGAWAAFAFKYESKGVQKERVRVETRGKKIDAQAQAARKRATSDADSVLERYYRDR